MTPVDTQPVELSQADWARFWVKVREESRGFVTPCWIYTGSTFSNGYGYFHVGSKAQRRVYTAHRLAWTFLHGDPGARFVLHKCDVPACVRHLFLGTQADNLRDMSQKGRGRRSRITDEQKAEIRTLYATGQFTHAELGAMFKCSAALIGLITTRKM